jgi:hypothetical protein
MNASQALIVVSTIDIFLSYIFLFCQQKNVGQKNIDRRFLKPFTMAETTIEALFTPQSDHRIDLRRPPRRYPASRQRHES